MIFFFCWILVEGLAGLSPLSLHISIVVRENTTIRCHASPGLLTRSSLNDYPCLHDIVS